MKNSRMLLALVATSLVASGAALALPSSAQGSALEPTVTIATGNLRITATGTTGATATITGPNRFAKTVKLPVTLTALVPGQYTVTPKTLVTVKGRYVPAPARRTVAVMKAATATTSFAFTFVGQPVTAKATINASAPTTTAGAKASLKVTLTNQSTTRTFDGFTLIVPSGAAAPVSLKTSLPTWKATKTRCGRVTSCAYLVTVAPTAPSAAIAAGKSVALTIVGTMPTTAGSNPLLFTSLGRGYFSIRGVPPALGVKPAAAARVAITSVTDISAKPPAATPVANRNFRVAFEIRDIYGNRVPTVRTVTFSVNSGTLGGSLTAASGTTGRGATTVTYPTATPALTLRAASPGLTTGIKATAVAFVGSPNVAITTTNLPPAQVGTETTVSASLPSGSFGPVSLYSQPAPCSLGVIGSCETVTLDGTFTQGATHLYSNAAPAGMNVVCGYSACPEITTSGAVAHNAAFASNLGNGFEHSALTPVIYAVAVQPGDGKILVGGTFTARNGVDVPDGLVRLNVDGTLDTAFNTNLGVGFDTIGLSSAYAQIEAIALQTDGKILVGGYFGGLNGVSTGPRYFMRLNADGSPDTVFNQALGIGLNQQVRAIAVQSDGKIILGGSFDSLNNAQVPHGLVRLESTGALDNSSNFNPLLGTGLIGGSAYSLAVQPDGKVLVGGLFTALGATASTTPTGHLLRLDSAGNLDTAFNANLGSGFADPFLAKVAAIAVRPSGHILIGGRFTSLNGKPSAPDNLLQLLPTGNPDATFNASLGTGFDDDVYSLALQQDGKVLVGGLFLALNGNGAAVPDGIVRLTTSAMVDTPFTVGLGSGLDLAPWSIGLSPYGDSIVLGGSFTSLAGDDADVPNGLLQLTPDHRLTDYAYYPLKVSLKVNGVYQSFGLAPPCDDLGPASARRTGQLYTALAQSTGYCMDVWAIDRNPDYGLFTRNILFVEDPRLTPISRK